MAKNPFFEGIRDAMEEFVADLRAGRPMTVHEVEMPDPPRPMSARQIVRLRRDKLQVSQALFASLLNTAPQTVHAWEQGRNRPSGIALRFLRLIENQPELLGYKVTTRRVAPRPAGRKVRASAE